LGWFFFSSRRRHTRFSRDWSSDVCSSDLKDIPPPKQSDTKETRALVFDSYYDDYRGVVLYVRIFNGQIEKNSGFKMMATKKEGRSEERRVGKESKFAESRYHKMKLFIRSL